MNNGQKISSRHLKNNYGDLNRKPLDNAKTFVYPLRHWSHTSVESSSKDARVAKLVDATDLKYKILANQLLRGTQRINLAFTVPTFSVNP